VVKLATILAHIAVKPGAAAAFEAIARKMHAASHGHEAALIRYEYWRGEAADRYFCLLAFEDYRGFLAHQASPHHEAAAAPLMDLIAELRLEWLDPVPGASPLAPTMPQAIATDASDTVRRYADMFPALVAAWWGPLRALAPAG
jgi:quinol monooxygenase YgiN